MSARRCGLLHDGEVVDLDGECDEDAGVAWVVQRGAEFELPGNPPPGACAHELDGAVRAVPEDDISSAHADEFGSTQPDLAGDYQQRVVASSGPGVPVRGCVQCIDLWSGRERDECSIAAFGWDGENPRDEFRVFRVPVGGESEYGAHRGSLALRVEMLQPRFCSRQVRNPPIVTASRSSKSS